MLRFEKRQRGTDRTGLLAAFLDETATRRAARQRLDAKRAAAGKQIQAARAINTRCEPIEQGLPDTIGSWPHALGRIELDHARAPFTAHHAQLAGAASVHRTPRPPRTRCALTPAGSNPTPGNNSLDFSAHAFHHHYPSRTPPPCF